MSDPKKPEEDIVGTEPENLNDEQLEDVEGGLWKMQNVMVTSYQVNASGSGIDNPIDTQAATVGAGVGEDSLTIDARFSKDSLKSRF